MTFPESEQVGLALRKLTGVELALLDEGEVARRLPHGYGGVAPDLPGTTLPPLWRVGY